MSWYTYLLFGSTLKEKYLLPGELIPSCKSLKVSFVKVKVKLTFVSLKGYEEL